MSVLWVKQSKIYHRILSWQWSKWRLTECYINRKKWWERTQIFVVFAVNLNYLEVIWSYIYIGKILQIRCSIEQQKNIDSCWQRYSFCFHFYLFRKWCLSIYHYKATPSLRDTSFIIDNTEWRTCAHSILSFRQHFFYASVSCCSALILLRSWRCIILNRSIVDWSHWLLRL